MFVKGIQNETFVLNGVEPSKLSVDDLKMIISRKLEIIPVSEQRLLFAGFLYKYRQNYFFFRTTIGKWNAFVGIWG